MKTVTDLLREADPLNEDAARLDDARDRIRRTAIARASGSLAESLPDTALPHRRTTLGVVGALAAALLVTGLIVGSGYRNTLQAAVRFEVRLAEARPVPGLIVSRIANTGRLIYLHPEILVSNDDVAQSWVTEDGPDRFSISVELLQSGAERLRQATTDHVGRPVAILIDGDIVSAPVVRSAIGNAAKITGDFTRAEAERIAGGIAMR